MERTAAEQQPRRCGGAHDCGEVKPVSAFGRTTTGRVKTSCRACEASAQRRRRADSPDVVLRSNLKSKYGLTPEDVQSMRERQDFRCAACGTHEDELPKRKARGRPRLDGQANEWRVMDIDHAHNDGVRVRALLCPNCNTALGLLGDDPARLASLLRYALWSASIDEHDPRPAILTEEAKALYQSHHESLPRRETSRLAG